jgi:hypothetical protein
MSKLFLTLLAGALLSACGGGPRVSEPTRYDLGVPAGAAATWRLHLGATDVQAASWLASTAMHYRLAYAEPLRRQSYGESRWVARAMNWSAKRRCSPTRRKCWIERCHFGVPMSRAPCSTP